MGERLSRRGDVSWTVLFGRLRSRLAQDLPPELRAFQWSATSWMAKLWYGNRALHYEIWIRHSAKVVEVGLHFEADALTNARLAAAFRARARPIARGLGAAVRIEEWDKGWARVWEPFPLAPADDGIGERVATRFADYVRLLEPILREELPADVAWRLPDARGGARVSGSRASRSGRR